MKFDNIKPAFVNSLLIICILIFALVNTIGTDDGWISMNIQYYMNTHQFHNVVTNSNMLNGKFIIFFNGIAAQAFGFNYITTKIVQIIMLIVSTLLLGVVIAQTMNKSYSSTGQLLFVLYGVSTGILTGNRYEAVYVGMLIFLFFFIVRHIEKNGIRYIYYASLCAALALSAHPNGVAAPLIFLIYMIVICRKEKSIYVHIFGSTTLMAITVYLCLFLDVSFEEYFKSLRYHVSFGGYGTPFYREYERYSQLLRRYLYLLVPLLMGLGGLFLMYKDCFQRKGGLFKNATIQYLMVMSSIFIFLYLTINGSKMYYYLALQFVFLIIGFIYFLERNGFGTHIKYVNTILVVMIMMVIFINIHRNETLINMLGVKSARAAQVSKVQNLTKDGRVIGPTKCFYIFSENSKFIPVTKTQYTGKIKEFDWIVIGMLEDPKAFESRFNIKMRQIQTFIYNGDVYNLYKQEYLVEQGRF